MPEPIDRDALKNHLYQAQAEAFKHSEWYVAGAIQSFIDILDKQPTIEADPVGHGRTNGDRIRQMTDEELADVMQGQCACCAYQLTGCTEKECKDGAYEWLKQKEREDVWGELGNSF